MTHGWLLVAILTLDGLIVAVDGGAFVYFHDEPERRLRVLTTGLLLAIIALGLVILALLR